MNIPPVVALAHGYLHAYELSSDSQQPTLWENSELLHHCPSLRARLHVFGNHVCNWLHIPLPESDEHSDQMPPIFLPAAGDFHIAIRHVARSLAYTTPTIPTGPQISDTLLANTTPQEITSWLGVHPWRLFAYLHWTTEQHQGLPHDITEMLLAAKLYMRAEISAIVAAFHLGANAIGPAECPVVNRENLIAARARISFEA